MRLSLTELANEHGSDKGTRGPSDDWTSHNYTDVYDAYLSAIRDHPVTMLEIGLGVDGAAWTAHIQHGRNAEGGASIKAWRDYFHNGHVYGVDINPAEHLDDERLTTFVADQSSPEDLLKVVEAVEGGFDIILDDGSHHPEHQQVSLGVLFPHLRPGGLYMIEDLAENGQGDGKTGRKASSEVLNTRRVLRTFRRDGTFPQPHVIPEADSLASSIESVAFHCPLPTVQTEGATRAERLTNMVLSRTGIKKDVKRLVRYTPGSEKVCVIRKAE